MLSSIIINNFCCSICYTKLKLLLLAVEISNENGIGTHLTINPGSAVKIESGTRGFFIAGSCEETKRAYLYCELCYKDVSDLKLIKKCKCHRGELSFPFFCPSLHQFFNNNNTMTCLYTIPLTVVKYSVLWDGI